MRPCCCNVGNASVRISAGSRPRRSPAATRLALPGGLQILGGSWRMRRTMTRTSSCGATSAFHHDPVIAGLSRRSNGPNANAASRRVQTPAPRGRWAGSAQPHRPRYSTIRCIVACVRGRLQAARQAKQGSSPRKSSMHAATIWFCNAAIASGGDTTAEKEQGLRYRRLQPRLILIFFCQLRQRRAPSESEKT